MKLHPFATRFTKTGYQYSRRLSKPHTPYKHRRNLKKGSCALKPITTPPFLLKPSHFPLSVATQRRGDFIGITHETQFAITYTSAHVHFPDLFDNLARTMKKFRKHLPWHQPPACLDQQQETGREPTLSSPSHPRPSMIPPIPGFPDGIEVLHGCPDASVDICFVHGLTGDRDSTWTADGKSTPWPKTLLPLKLKRARILTYGYDAYVVKPSVASSNRLIDHATNLLNDLTTDRARCNASSRPLIFVAHSLGGLVCKEAILLSRNNPDDHLRGLISHTKGIIFMGTPHKGSWMAEWTKIPASALGLVKSTNKSLLKILETDDQFLESIQVGFLAMIREQREGGRRLEITCFFFF